MNAPMRLAPWALELGSSAKSHAGEVVFWGLAKGAKALAQKRLIFMIFQGFESFR